MVLEKTPESPLDSKEIKPSHLSEINPEYLLEGLMLKLKYIFYIIYIYICRERERLYNFYNEKLLFSLKGMTILS